MKRILATVIVMLIPALGLHAQSAPDGPALTSLLKEFLAGASRNDAAMHDRFWAEDLIYTGSSGRRIGKADIMRDQRSSPAPKPGDPATAYSAEDIRIQQYGTTAIVAFRLVGTTKRAGKTETSNYLNTGTFLKRNGKWQVVSWQATRMPRSEEDSIRPQAPQPDGAGIRAGVLPRTWLLGGPKCVEIPEFQVHEYNEDFYILRQSGCSNFEKPFLYLLFGRDKALLLDTGAGKTDIARVVSSIIEKWLARNKKKSIELVAAHTHSHDDHTGGDELLKSLPRTTLVLPNLTAVQSFFGIKNWPEEIVQYDLGDRIVDVIPIPGHEAASIAIYDRQTAILFTGDTLYPGRLYVKDHVQFIHSIQRLVDFTQNKLVAHIFGNHIENTRTPYLDYRVGTVYQPDEHALELGRGDLLELNEALRQMNAKLVRMAMRDFTIWPK